MAPVWIFLYITNTYEITRVCRISHTMFLVSDAFMFWLHVLKQQHTLPEHIEFPENMHTYSDAHTHMYMYILIYREVWA